MDIRRPNLANPIHFLAFGFGSGLSPWAPGTFGTLAALPVCWLCSFLPLWGYLLVTAAIVAVGPAICGRAARDMNLHDHPGIVWDELAGLMITMIAVPRTPWLVLAGFVAFRFYDIVKPPPIGWLDRRIHGGLGIMLDDIVAGLFALVTVWAGIWILRF